VKCFLLAILVPAAVATASSQSRVTPHANRSWHLYRDDVNGIAFSYPPDLRVVTPSVADQHIEGLVSLVLLVRADDPRPHRSPTVSVHVKVCGDRLVSCFDEARLRIVCDRFESFPVGDGRAFQCVNYGRAACHWSAVVLRGKREVTIQTPTADYHANQDAGGSRPACVERLIANRKTSPLAGILASFAVESR